MSLKARLKKLEQFSQVDKPKELHIIIQDTKDTNSYSLNGRAKKYKKEDLKQMYPNDDFIEIVYQ